MISLTLTDAQIALKRYNRPEVTRIDALAKAVFSTQLPVDVEHIEAQVDFVLFQYGGLKYARKEGLAAAVAYRIAESRDTWRSAFDRASRYELGDNGWVPFVPDQTMFDAFSPLRTVGDAAVIRCLTKYLHLSSPHCFIVQDRWIGAALGVDVGHDAGPETYQAFAFEFKAFVQRHLGVFQTLSDSDQPKSWSDIKLIDKVLLCRSAAAIKLRLAA